MLLMQSSRQKCYDFSMQTCNRMLRLPYETEGVPYLRDPHRGRCQNFYSLIHSLIFCITQ
jgi:hypothetical protein